MPPAWRDGHLALRIPIAGSARCSSSPAVVGRPAPPFAGATQRPDPHRRTRNLARETPAARDLVVAAGVPHLIPPDGDRLSLVTRGITPRRTGSWATGIRLGPAVRRRHPPVPVDRPRQTRFCCSRGRLRRAADSSASQPDRYARPSGRVPLRQSVDRPYLLATSRGARSSLEGHGAVDDAERALVSTLSGRVVIAPEGAEAPARPARRRLTPRGRRSRAASMSAPPRPQRQALAADRRRSPSRPAGWRPRTR